MTGLCGGCAYWTRHAEEPDLRLGDCQCESFVATYSIPRHVEPGSVFVEVDEGWGFYTDQEFGCIHWTKPEEATA